MNLSPELQEMCVEVIIGLAVALAGSETLPFIKKVKGNGLVHMAWGFLKAMVNYNPTRPK